MTPLRLFNPGGFRSTLSSATSLRVEVRPPSLCHAPSSFWQRVMFRLLRPASQNAAPPLNRLPGVRDDFVTALAGIAGHDAATLIDRISQARSLRELWHLRADVYHMVALQLNQDQAEQRLSALNRHFLTRIPRSAFSSL